MDWQKIENDVFFQTQQAFSVSVTSSTIGTVGSNIPIDRKGHTNSNKSNQGYDHLQTYGNHHTFQNFTTNETEQLSNNNSFIIDSHIKDLRKISSYHDSKFNNFENMLSSFGEVLETSTSTQSTLADRVDDIEQSIRNNTKLTSETNRSASSVNIQIKSLASKVEVLEDYVHQNESIFATKESFSQLLDSTVGEIRSVSIAVSNATVKSSQSMFFIEALIQAMYRLKGDNNTPHGGGVEDWIPTVEMITKFNRYD